MRVYKEFSCLMKTLRKEHKISQVELAHCVGMTQSSIARIEQGLSRPLLHNALAIGKILYIDLNYLTRFVRTYEPPKKEKV